MKRIVFLLFFVIATPVFTAPIDVRAGKHTGFDRIVLHVPAGIEWVAEVDEQIVKVDFPSHKEGFDTTSIYSRIGKEFVHSVNSENSSIELQLSCACEVDISKHDARMIVIDVLEAAATSSQLTEPPKSTGFRPPLRYKVKSAGPSSVQEYTPNLTFGLFTKATKNSTVGSVKNSLADKPYHGGETLSQSDLKNVMERLSSGATRGLLTAELSTPKVVRPSAENKQETYTSAGSKEIIGDILRAGNIRVLEGPSFQDEERAGEASTTSFTSPCDDAPSFDIQNWGGDGFPLQNISELRSQLYGEFGEVNENIAREMAKVFLHYGFGAEAIQMLEVGANQSGQTLVLIEMAEVIEYGEAVSSNYMSGLPACNKDAVLWAILSSDGNPAIIDFDVNAALVYLNGLPLHLKAIVAPVLSQRLLNYGNEEAAGVALRTLERSTTPLPSAARLTKAELELAHGNTKSAQSHLTKVVSASDEKSAMALIELVETYLKNDNPIPPDVAALVESYAFELRSHPIGKTLNRSYVLALAKSNQFGEAFRELSRFKQLEVGDGYNALASGVLKVLAKDASDADFLLHVFDLEASVIDGLSEASRLLVAERLFELGFAEQADTFLPGIEEYDREAYSVVKSAAALKLGRPNHALALISRNTSSEADSLRARSYFASGNYSDAHREYSKVGDKALSQAAAVLSEEWLNLVSEDDAMFGPLVPVATAEVRPLDPSSGLIGEGEEAIAGSQDARRAINNLLLSLK